MYAESDLLPLSALQHLVFCERQCALIYIEQQWAENRFTAEGRLLHERTHEEEREWQGDILIVRGLRIRSLTLGLAGMADVVEFRDAGLPAANGRDGAVAGIDRRDVQINVPTTPRRPERLLTRSGPRVDVRPVEYKRGRPKRDRCDAVQLCAQAICLEEMLNVTVETGDLYYGSQRRRYEVPFTAELRAETIALAARLHALFASGVTPGAKFEKKCVQCSLLDLCIPSAVQRGRRVREYIAEWVFADIDVERCDM